MTTKEEFLATVRARLGPGSAPYTARPLATLPDGPAPDVRYAVDLTDRTQAFSTALTAAGGSCRDLRGSGEQLAGLIREVVASENVATAVVSDDPECAGVAELLRELGVDVLSMTGPGSAADADLGVTGALAGIALTGSVVVDSARAGSRSASLLPRVHLAVLREGSLLATPGELFRSFSERYPSGLPSQLVLITGPSRSADIELIITLGVHGPQSVIVAVVQ